MEHDFSSSTASSVTVGTTSTKVLEKKSGRTFAILSNLGDEVMFINMGNAAVMNKGIPIYPQGSYELSGERLYRGAIYGICTSGSKTMSILEA